MSALWFAAVIALLVVLVAILAAALDRDELIESRNESLTFIRLMLTGFFGAVVGQALAPLDPSWWIAAAGSLLLSLSLLLSSQILAKRLATTAFANGLVKISARVVSSLDLAFTPLSTAPKDEADQFEQELLESVDEFGETIAREVMVPRVDMAVIGYDVTLDAAVTEFLATGYSRLPVVGKNIDDITGVLYLKDVTRALVTNRDGAAVTTAASKARPAMFVPESKPVDELLRDMQKSATHIAIVVDEYGGVAGLVTMEDVIEEIVGEIADEYDRELPDVVEVSERVLLVSAKYSLFDLGERFGIDIEDDDVDSVGGLLNKQLGRLPTKGDSVVASGLRLTAERFEGRPKRLMRVLVEPSQDLVEAQKAFEDNDN